MRFDKVVIVGSGKIACDCLRHLITILEKQYIVALETQENSLSMLRRICEKEHLDYSMLLKKRDIENYLLDTIKNKSVLILSVNNRYIFTADIINSPNVEIINFHYSLLPHYRGMNIPTWVIFNGETHTGITWHFVTEQVDCGKIIEQRVFTITKETTAFDITRQGMILGLEAFKSFSKKLLDEKIDGKEVVYPQNEKIYFNSCLPMNGILNLNQPIDRIETLLKSFDYGKTEVIPPLQLNYGEKRYVVQDYKIKEKENILKRNLIIDEKTLILQEKDREILLYLQEV